HRIKAHRGRSPPGAAFGRETGAGRTPVTAAGGTGTQVAEREQSCTARKGVSAGDDRRRRRGRTAAPRSEEGQETRRPCPGGAGGRLAPPIDRWRGSAPGPGRAVPGAAGLPSSVGRRTAGGRPARRAGSAGAPHVKPTRGP